MVQWAYVPNPRLLQGVSCRLGEDQSSLRRCKLVGLADVDPKELVHHTNATDL